MIKKIISQYITPTLIGLTTLAIVNTTTLNYANAYNNGSIQIKKEQLLKDRNLVNLIGLPENLFDNKIEKDNPELDNSGIELLVKEKTPYILTNIKSSDDKKTEEYSFKIDNEQFNKIIAHLNLSENYRTEDIKKRTRDWSLDWQVGISAGEGAHAQTRYSKDITDKKEIYTDILVSSKTIDSTIGIITKDQEKEKDLSFKYRTGTDINDDNYSVERIDYLSHENNSNITRIMQLGRRNIDNSELEAKIGAVKSTDDYGIGLSAYNQGIIGTKIYLALLNSDSDKKEANNVLATQMSNYDRFRRNGNHPILSSAIDTQLSLGYEDGDMNIEGMKSFNNTIGIFSGIGNTWHNNNPYGGIILKIGDNYPGIAFSLSKGEFLFDITTPRREFTEFKEKLMENY
jgi:hypothetical protein